MRWYKLVPRRLRRSALGQRIKYALGLSTVDDIAHEFGIPPHTMDLLIRMEGNFPTHRFINSMAKRLRADPDMLLDPLALYRHVYNNGNEDASRPDKFPIFLFFDNTEGETVTRIMQANLQSIGLHRNYRGLANVSPEWLLACFRDLPPERQTAERELWSRYGGFAEHCLYGMHEMIFPEHRYFTLLRHPVDRLIDHCRRLEAMRVERGEKIEHASVQSYIHNEGFQRDYLFGYSYVQRIAGYPTAGRFAMYLRRDDMLNRALTILSSLDVVLISERFEESVALLCKTLNWSDSIILNGKIVPRGSAIIDTSMTPGTLRNSLSTEDRACAEDFLHEDIVLYEHACKLFEARLIGAPAPRTPLLPSLQESEPPMSVFRTSIGPVHVSARWAMLARKAGADPAELEIAFRESYYNKHMEGDVFIRALSERFGVDPLIPRMWIETNHAEHICTEVIEWDDYGLKKMKQEGFAPKTILDIGGHIGTFSLMAHHLWPDAKIVIIEPLTDDHIDPNNAKILQKNVEHIPRLRIVTAALIGFIDADATDNAQRITELLEDRNHEHWVELGLRGYERYADTMRRSGMQSISVARLVREYDMERIDLLKIDCEGSETNILREFCALGLLPQIDRITGEWHGDVAKHTIPGLLESTHDIEWLSVAPLHKSGIFTAQRKHRSV